MGVSFVKHIFLILLIIKTCCAYRCYVCHEQEENNGKCTTTVEHCGHGEDACLTRIKWGSIPYWNLGVQMQYYISKNCSTMDHCLKQRNKLMVTANSSLVLCDRIWWKDWECVECCKGDRCNYYVTLEGHSFSASLLNTSIFLLISLYIMYIHTR